MMKRILFLALSLILLVSCANNANDVEDVNSPAVAETPLINYSVLNIYPHDTTSFTEGLLVHDGLLFESTGGQPDLSHFKSGFGPVDLKTGKYIKKVMLDTSYFGEGITILNGKIYQLTWQDQKGFVYDARSLKKLRDFSYTGDGWALTNDGTNLIMSDGTNKLRYLSPDSLRLLKILGVQDNFGPVGNINELEYINGYIYANQYLTNYILKIDPASGKVLGKLDFTTLYNEVKVKYPQSLEMNGIAYDSLLGKIYVTGKAWPHLYEVKF